MPRHKVFYKQIQEDQPPKTGAKNRIKLILHYILLESYAHE